MKTIKGRYEFKQEIKKSVFITNIAHVDTEQEAKDFVEEISNKYKDARHNVYTYIVDNKEKYYDAGEPKGTAGVPMHSILKQKELDNIVVVISRYFGGIKLGSGGLIRAYRGGVTNALDQIDLIDIKALDTLEYEVNMEDVPQYENWFRSQKNISFEIKENTIIITGERDDLDKINDKFMSFKSNK